MLFPTINKQITWVIAGIALGIIITVAFVAVVAFKQVNGSSALAVTATPTKTPTKQVTATATTTPSGTPTNPPTVPSTATPIPLPIKTSTNTPTPTSTATFTLTPELAITFNPSKTTTISTEPTITATFELTHTLPLTTSEVITPMGTPTPTPTPVPRTVMAPIDIPNYAEIEDHFWFTRPFTDAYKTWGSYYYPYGTNGRGQYLWHHGIDIENPQGTTIVAVGAGTVNHAGPDDEALLGLVPNFYGQAVVIEHDQRWQDQPVYTLYGHVSKVLVQPGQRVEAGDPIAEVGQAGVAIGPHLNLEIRIGSATYDDTRNPDLWIRPDPGHGVIAGRVVDYQGYYVPQQLITLHRAEAPSRFWRETYTYPDNEVNADEAYFETFTFSDVLAGNYLLKTFFDGRQLTVPVAVTNSVTSFVLLQQTQSLLPTPDLSPTPPIRLTVPSSQEDK